MQYYVQNIYQNVHNTPAMHVGDSTYLLHSVVDSQVGWAGPSLDLAWSSHPNTQGHTYTR
jgi:hypothetical protein